MPMKYAVQIPATLVVYVDDAEIPAQNDWVLRRAALTIKARRAIRKAKLTLGHLEVACKHAPELGDMVVWPFETVEEPEVHPVMEMR